MRAIVQRVTQASVKAEGIETGRIGIGLLVLLGITHSDEERDAEVLGRKIIQARIFSDSDNKMNLSVLDVGGELLVVSQFTLYGDTRKGNRPSYSDAAGPEVAKQLYEHFIIVCRYAGIKVATGEFRAHMEVSLVNDGPVTLIFDTKI